MLALSAPTEQSALGYEVKFQTVGMAGGADLKIRSLLDLLQFHDPLGEAAAAGVSSATWPLFGQLWPSAKKLAELMQTLDLRGRRILETGCGLALASLVIHRRGGDATASDCHPLAETFLQANAALNQLPAMKYRAGVWGKANPGLGEFDLIIASDVLYERGHPAQLSDFIQAHAASTAEVLIIDPSRGNRSAFNRRMAAFGFSFTETRIETSAQDGTPYRGRLMRYLRTQPHPAITLEQGKCNVPAHTAH